MGQSRLVHSIEVALLNVPASFGPTLHAMNRPSSDSGALFSLLTRRIFASGVSRGLASTSLLLLFKILSGSTVRAVLAKPSDRSGRLLCTSAFALRVSATRLGEPVVVDGDADCDGGV